MASPTFIGAFIGLIIYANNYNTVGLTIGILILVIGVICGILLANWARKNGGTVDFMARIDASPDIDEAIREKNGKERKK